jgi:hypothetical protein
MRLCMSSPESLLYEALANPLCERPTSTDWLALNPTAEHAMTTSDWLGILGILGAIAGVGGLVVSGIAYRKVSAMKCLDPRVQARKAPNGLHAGVAQAQQLHGAAKRSRTAPSAATGIRASDAMKQWQDEWQRDHDELVKVAASMPATSEGFSATVPVHHWMGH